MEKLQIRKRDIIRELEMLCDTIDDYCSEYCDELSAEQFDELGNVLEYATNLWTSLEILKRP